MTVYRHLLAAVDFHDESDAVVARAEALRRSFDARLGLVHVVEFMSTTFAGELPTPVDLELERELMASARERLEAIGTRLGVDIADTHVELGDPAERIADIVDSAGIDLVVVGSHGRHGLSALLGSTADDIVHHIRCDVLTVHLDRTSP